MNDRLYLKLDSIQAVHGPQTYLKKFLIYFAYTRT